MQAPTGLKLPPLAALEDEALVDLLQQVRRCRPADPLPYPARSHRQLVAEISQLLYDRHHAPLTGYLYGLCQHHDIAADVYQETWIKVWRAIERWRPEARFVTFLYTVARRCLSDIYYRREQKRLFASDNVDDLVGSADEPVSACPLPDEWLESRQLVAIFRWCLQQLPLPQREAFLLSQEHDLTAAAIADMTGASKEAAKSRVRYAMARLRTCISERSEA